MNKITQSLLASALFSMLAFATPACSDDDPVVTQPGHGIENCEWADVNDADLKGQTLIYEFDAPAPWVATSSDSWCTLLTESGAAGKSSLRIKVAPNEGESGRSATITIQVEGYAEQSVLTIRQGEGFLEKGEGKYRDVNNWVYEFMAANYLWNENIPDMRLDYSLDYQQFLLSMLDGVAKNGDANHDDGYWANGERLGYYTYIQSNAPLSRSAGDRFTDSGLAIIPTILGSRDDDPCGFAVRWVTPGSPADIAGVKRGDFISTVNKIAVTQNNYTSLGNSVLNGNVTIDLNDVTFTNGSAVITNKVKSVLVGKDTYTDPSIYKAEVVEMPNGKKVAYLMYFGFHTDYDDQLNDVFAKFKSEGAEELVIDLRYNPGGHVLSSTVLGTLVAGAQHKGDVYVQTTYNSTRSAAGEVGQYKIGEGTNPESNKSYDPIVKALDNSLNLKRVFVIGSGTTASASELIINGLRGLDITVNLVGTTTHGKNVGMEGWQKKFGSYNFLFYPVTFFCENAKGFRDYSNGFTPDLYIDDSTTYPGDFGTMKDALSSNALVWASTGSQPSKTSARSTTGNIRVLKATPEMESLQNRRMGGSLTMPREISE